MAGFTPPSEFDRFRLVRSLAQGGMGDVWLYTDTKLERDVALKFIADPDPDDDDRERFLLEGQALAQIRHPNVVTVLDVSEVSAHPFLVTEFVPGAPLAQLDGPVRRTRLLELALGLAGGSCIGT